MKKANLMPLPNWLRRIFHGSRHTAPARHGLPPTNQPSGVGDSPANPPRVDNDVRAHIAAHDPAFPAKRETAIGSIQSAIDAVALAQGFIRKPMSWAQSGPLGTVSIHVQRGRYGTDCAINLGFHPLDAQRNGPWAMEDAIPLGRFHPSSREENVDAASLFYLDVIDDPDLLPFWMAVLSDRALPWLLAHLTLPDAADVPFGPPPETGTITP